MRLYIKTKKYSNEMISKFKHGLSLNIIKISNLLLDRFL